MNCVNCKSRVEISKNVNKDYGWYLSEQDLVRLIHAAGSRRLSDTLYNEMDEYSTRICLCEECRDKLNKPWDHEETIIDLGDRRDDISQGAN